MANPRQRRKARSSTHTGRSQRAKRATLKKQSKAPEVKGPSILKERWDSKATVRQNYARLGLLPSTAISQSGGVEDLSIYNIGSAAPSGAEQLESQPAARAQRAQTGRIIRDGAGRVTAIIEAQESSESADTPWGAPLNTDDHEHCKQTSSGPGRKSTTTAALQGDERGATVAALEALQAEAAPVLRHVSTVEASWLIDLVRKHDADYNAMSADLSLNKLQQSAGQIKRAMNKAGGVDVIKSHLQSQGLQ